MFGTSLVEIDPRDAPYPVLAERVPELNTDSWRVMPDGSMQTTYRLRPDLVWHDGTPLTAGDFAFAHRLNNARIEWGLSVSAISPLEQRAIQDIEAPDARTLVINWKQAYADAFAPELWPLPRHILEATFETGQPELLGAHPYWTTEHIGVGPYRLTRWEQGAFIEASAFGRFALGRPKIERMRVTWSRDANVTVARLLSGDAHITMDRSIYAQDAAILRTEWVAKGAGTIVSSPGWLRFLASQHRPEHAAPASLLDVRTRRAVASALDRQAIADAMLDGEGTPADSMAPPSAGIYPAVERAITKNPYDLRRTEQLLGEVGYTKGPDGLFTGFRPEVLGTSEGDEGREATIVADYMHRAGIDVQLRLVQRAQLAQSDELKATYPGFRTNQSTPDSKLSADRMLGSRAATAENRWSGTNKMGWSHAEHDRLYDQFTRALNRAQRTEILVQIMKITNEEMAYIPMYFTPDLVAHTAELVGPVARGLETSRHANLHEWHWR
jgi:peptide/nickel transport system substrate-binding protein